jgi:protein-L-isoaspartate O-methyltransferase
MPSLMVHMLQLLNVSDASSVLEIGTATGYNAALLCHRLGADQVASIELHPRLAADAAEHLHGLGYDPPWW